MADELPQEHGVKELLELVAGLKEVAVLAKKALADGKIDLADLGLLAEVLAKQQVLMDAAQGLDLLDDEIKNLNLDEAMEVISALVAALKEIRA